ncbi:MAG TPA: hypothetical protein PLO29_00625 [Paludibacter sp.]|nr:MAG: hypothetical protein BWY08_01808 [Bacteroidetes bacterium ADurb.Bin174]HPH47375.1 hypothetical protein [Chryseolinea sp.]HQB27429.1 hypothetical protein [Paludibacter sp.]
MKTVNIFKILPFFVLLVSACVEEELIMPVASVEVSKTVYGINESVVFNFTGQAQQVAIFPGDNTHNYDLFESGGNTGFVVNKGTFSYAYKQPGTYKVVVVASNYSEGAVNMLKDTTSVMIQVIDDDVTIKSLSCPRVLYDEIAAVSVNETDWLVCLPQRVLFRGQQPNIPSTQRLAVKLASDSTVLLVDGFAFSATKNYQLNNPLTLSLTAHAGNVMQYTLYMLRLPEFSVFKLNGVDGVLTRSEFNYDKMTMTVTLPAGTDKTKLVPEFTLSQGQEVFVNDMLIRSAVSEIDFSMPVVFRIRNTYPDKSYLIAETEVTVSVL